LATLQKEIILRKDYLNNEEIGSIYFGGGTPSLLTIDEIETLLNLIQKNFRLKTDLEISFEANPDDISKPYVNALKESGVNRLSLGIQSFNEQDLQMLGRVHSSHEALNSVEAITLAGFRSFSIDLIYGIPGSDNKTWLNNLMIFKQYNIPHLSSYSLTREPKTILDFQIRRGIKTDTDEEQMREQFYTLTGFMQENKYVHYEISNFCKPDHISIHNSNYWKNKKYMGIGPSAHSYNLIQRQWNIGVNKDYMEGVDLGSGFFETELLSLEDQFNEYLMLGLRTMWGVNLSKLYRISPQFNLDAFEDKLNFYIQNRFVKREQDIILLTNEGILFSDQIISELFIVQ